MNSFAIFQILLFWKHISEWVNGDNLPMEFVCCCCDGNSDENASLDQTEM